MGLPYAVIEHYVLAYELLIYAFKNMDYWCVILFYRNVILKGIKQVSCLNKYMYLSVTMVPFHLTMNYFPKKITQMNDTNY